MKDCVVLYEKWQMDCCGTPFSMYDMVQWLVCDGTNISLNVDNVKVDYCYEAHSSNYKGLYNLSGKVVKICALYRKYTKAVYNSKLLIPTESYLLATDSLLEIEDKIDDLVLNSYVVYLSDCEIVAAKKNEVTFS